VTAYLKAIDARDLATAGFSGLVEKPIRADALVAVVASAAGGVLRGREPAHV
jgi:CheY-like chemotaxis protein